MNWDSVIPGAPNSPITRRAAFVGAGALAVGASALAYAGVSDDPAQALPGHNVRDYGAAGDGRSDDTRRIQKAINAARGGGGIVFFPPGTYLTRRLTIYSRVHLRGSGGDATVLRLAAGENSAILESDGFERLTGTRSAGGVTMFSVRDLTLDGNKAHNPKAGYGLRVYGYGYELTEVVAFDCRTHGIASEWGGEANLPGNSHQMEARLSAVRSHNNGGNGFEFAGPHDSMFINCLAFHNSGVGFHLAGEAQGAAMVNCHAWGADQDVAFDLATESVSCMNCCADLEGGVGVRISRNDCRWLGGVVLGHNHAGPNREIGVQFAPGARPEEPAGCVIDTQIVNCATAAVDFEADRSVSTVRASVWQPGAANRDGIPVAGTGLGWIGTPSPTTQVEITQGLGNNDKNLVVRPAFDLRAQDAPPPPDPHTARVFARTSGGRTQLCAIFPNGTVQVLASES